MLEKKLRKRLLLFIIYHSLTDLFTASAGKCESEFGSLSAAATIESTAETAETLDLDDEQ